MVVRGALKREISRGERHAFMNMTPMFAVRNDLASDTISPLLWARVPIILIFTSCFLPY